MQDKITYRDADNRKRSISIIYADEFLFAVSKPSGLPVIPGRGQSSRQNMRDILVQRLENVPEIFQVHRIDADTSGLVLFACDADTHRHLNAQFADGLVQKRYTAICQGGPVDNDGEIDLPLRLDPSGKNRVQVHRSGKPSNTQYKVLRRFKRFTELAVYPRTGRTHQIRVHLSAMGYPLAIDPIYASSDPIYITEIKRRTRNHSDRPLISRLTLHAFSLSFTHPNTGKTVSLEAPLPKDMRGFLNALDKWSSVSGKDLPT